jgi:Zn-dependent protease
VPGGRPPWRRVVTGALGVLLLLAGKLKLLVLGLTKVKTVFSMFAFFGLYWSTYGWPLALGLVGSIYAHEMGHVAALRRRGIAAGAPLFIPGVGAVVLLKERIDDPHVDADVGLAGPVWGLGAALAAYAMYAATGVPVWRAIAQLGGVINLFNLIPVWQLDGARGLHALARAERWAVVAAAAVAYAVSRQPLLLVVGAVGAWRATRGEPGPGDRRALITFAGLVAALTWLASLPGPR